MRIRIWVPLFVMAFSVSAAIAEVKVRDGSGRDVVLARPAQRIVSLAPHATETIYAAGAGNRLVGVVQFSDFPVEARALPRVGSFAGFDLEAIVALKPDLIVGWPGGNPAAQLDQLQRLGFAIYRSQSKRIEDVAVDIECIGELAGTAPVARVAAAGFRARLAQLRERYGNRPAVRVFYEVWNQPLLTISDAHVIGDVIAVCGGRNVFADLPLAAPQVDVEAVLKADPQAIIASGMAQERPEWLDAWRVWPDLRAVKHNRLYSIPPDVLQRASPRILDGAEAMCRALEDARKP
jgi:iron complex transport system substrate-binding protein